MSAVSDGPGRADDVLHLARRVHVLLLARGETLAVAESLTGGAVGAAMTAAPGASATFRGAVVAYASDLKVSLLGVDPGLLAQVGAVHPEVAAQLASGVRDRLAATYGLSTTGVAGPDPQDGRQPGEVYLGLARAEGTDVVALRLPGGRDQVRAATVREALAFLAERLAAAQRPG